MPFPKTASVFISMVPPVLLDHVPVRFINIYLIAQKFSVEKPVMTHRTKESYSNSMGAFESWEIPCFEPLCHAGFQYGL